MSPRSSPVNNNPEDSGNTLVGEAFDNIFNTEYFLGSDSDHGMDDGSETAVDLEAPGDSQAVEKFETEGNAGKGLILTVESGHAPEPVSQESATVKLADKILQSDG